MAENGKAYKVRANDCIFYFDESEVNSIDLVPLSPATYNCIHHHRSISASIRQASADNKKLTVVIAGETFCIEIKDQLDQMLEQMGFGTGVEKQLTDVKAPMPGLVLEIAVSEGQAVKKGDKILILEAMKMENSIMIPSDATIKRILVSRGQAVDRGQVLVELE